MAQVNVDLSEYDMLRASKDKAEAEVKDLKEEIKSLKDNINNVVVKNRYYVPSINYSNAARDILRKLGYAGIESFAKRIQYLQDERNVSTMYDTPRINEQLVQVFATVIQQGLTDSLNLRSSYVEDNISIEIRGFDEYKDTVKAQLELEYKDVLEQKKADLDRQLKVYDAKSINTSKEVEKAVNNVKEEYEKKLEDKKTEIEALNQNIKDLKVQLQEASKTSEEKLAEALAKLKEAQEEVAKYSKPKKKLFGIFG